MEDFIAGLFAVADSMEEYSPKAAHSLREYLESRDISRPSTDCLHDGGTRGGVCDLCDSEL